jgi:hypothetical protein
VNVLGNRDFLLLASGLLRAPTRSPPRVLRVAGRTFSPLTLTAREARSSSGARSWRRARSSPRWPR